MPESGSYSDWGPTAVAVGQTVAGIAGQSQANSDNIDWNREQMRNNNTQAFIANSESRQSQQRQNNFQLYMSNSAHQREQDDLKRAGLNPILAGMNSQGASTPSGGSMSGQAGSSGSGGGQQNIFSGINLAQNALEARRLKKELEQADAGIKLQHMQGEAAAAAGALDLASAMKVKSETKNLGLGRGALKAGADYDEAKSKMDQSYLSLDAAMTRISKGISTGQQLLDLANPFKFNPSLGKPIPGTKEGDRYRKQLEKQNERNKNRSGFKNTPLG